MMMIMIILLVSRLWWWTTIDKNEEQRLPLSAFAIVSAWLPQANSCIDTSTMTMMMITIIMMIANDEQQ